MSDLAFAREGQRLCEDVSLALLTVDARGRRRQRHGSDSGTWTARHRHRACCSAGCWLACAPRPPNWSLSGAGQRSRRSHKPNGCGVRQYRHASGQSAPSRSVPLVMTSELQTQSVIAGDWSIYSKLPAGASDHRSAVQAR